MSDAPVTCNSTYSLLSSPSWGNNCDIELILSDIPFISVGILAFGISMFFLATKRFTFSIVSLYFSVLLFFIAAIVDLTQFLIHNLSHVTIWPLITTREILLALSLGLRFVYYWLYISQPPIGEQRPPSFQIGLSNFLSLDRKDELHSGNWARWGVAGCCAKSALLATIPAIITLQIIWRVSQRHHSYGFVYAADVTLEVVVSVLFLLKLLLNTVPNSSVLRTHTFKECGFPALALVFNIGISIGGLIEFAFTESVVGRLLQGVELYIVIVFMTISHLFRHKTSPTVPNIRNLAMRKVELPEQLRTSTFRLSPPTVSTLRLPTPLSSETQGRNVNADAARHSSRVSVGRMIPWVPWRVSRIQSSQDGAKAKLWDRGEIEKGTFGPPGVSSGNVGRQSMASATPMDGKSTSWRDIVNDSLLNSLAMAMPDNLSVSTKSKDGSLNSKQWDAIRVSKRSLGIAIPATATSDESGAAVIMTAPPDPPSQDSPIYGSNRIIGQSPTPSKKRASGTSLDHFKELQIELDRIIATLRQFSPGSPISPTSAFTSESNSKNDENMHQPSSARQSSSTGRQSLSTVGARTLSDFSLSYFPDPPRSSPQLPSLPAPFPAHHPRPKEDRRARLGSRQDPSSDVLPLLPSPRIPAVLTDVPSSPHSDFTSDSPYQGNGTLPAAAGRSSRVNSGGTQYVITSFIDDLTTPDGSRGLMSGISLNEFREKSVGTIEDSSSLGSPRLPTTTLRPSPLRATTLSRLSPASARRRLSPLSIQERLSPTLTLNEHTSDPNSELVEPMVQRRMRPLILSSMTTTTSPQARPPSIGSDARPSRTMLGLPPRPRFRVPQPLPEDTRAFRAPERPKPPQLIFRSDDEYFARRTG